MREKEEGRNSISRRHADDDFGEIDSDDSPRSAQPLESLRSGYSWIRALEMRYSGWHLHPVEGFSFCLEDSQARKIKCHYRGKEPDLIGYWGRPAFKGRGGKNSSR